MSGSMKRDEAWFAEYNAKRTRWTSAGNLDFNVPIKQPSMSRGAGAGKPDGVLPALPAKALAALTLSLVLPWPPTANTNVRHGRHGHYMTPEHRRFRSHVATICRQVRAPLVPSPYRMTVVWYPPDRRARDSDNVLKPLRDALQHAGVIANDRLADCAAYSETAVMPSRPCDGAVHVRIEAQ